VATGKGLRPLAGHQGPITSLAFSDDGKALASASGDTTVLVWDVAGLGRGAGRRAAPLPAPKLAAWWADLAGADAARAYEAVWALAAGDSVPFLKERLRPVSPAGSEQVARLLADLDSDEFGVRERATRELAKLEEAAEPALRRALAGHPSPEVRRRVTGLLEGLEGRSPYWLRRLRALEVLELAGTPECRQVLQDLARGAPEARLTREAQAALRRLSRRGGTAPGG
jgi:hypothetical protein